MDDIPPRSYGPLIETTLRIVAWNVWGLYGPWPERETAIATTLKDAHPDIVVLTESWSKGGDSQSARLAGPLGLPHHAFSGVAAQEDQAALSGVAVLSRWPIQRQSSLTFGSARVQPSAVVLNVKGTPWRRPQPAMKWWTVSPWNISTRCCSTSIW